MTVVVSWPLQKVFVPLPLDQALTNEPLFKGTRGITVRSAAAGGCSATRSPLHGVNAPGQNAVPAQRSPHG
jgi:hypothetical protein